jgi:hypothetical protein
MVKDQREAIQDAKASLIEELQRINGQELQIAALAEVVNDFLANYKESQRTTDRKHLISDFSHK